MSPCPLHRVPGLVVVAHPRGDYGLAPRCGQPVDDHRCALQAGHPGECE